MRTPHRAPRALAPLLAVLATVVVALGLASTVPANAAGAGHTGRTSRSAHAATATSPTQVRDARVLALLNRARAHARTCGTTHFKAVKPLRENALLNRAASSFAALMGSLDFFDHTAPNGSTPGQRINATGYHWRSYGENIAAGYNSPASVVAGWLASPGHCANIMSPFREVGIGYALNSSSTYQSYWVLDFGTR